MTNEELSKIVTARIHEALAQFDDKKILRNVRGVSPIEGCCTHDEISAVLFETLQQIRAEYDI